MRTAALAVLLLPYVYYGVKDGVFHFRERSVSVAEHLTHVAIGFGAVGTIAAVFASRRGQLLRSLPLLLLAGALDEYFFHKGLPERETDMHAKAHWALLIFVAAGLSWS